MNLTFTQTILLALMVSVVGTAVLILGIKAIWWAWEKLRRLE
jgi:hypothetical protein